MSDTERPQSVLSLRPLSECEIRVSGLEHKLYRVDLGLPGGRSAGAITVEVNEDRITGVFSAPYERADMYVREDLRSPSPEMRARIIGAIRQTPGTDSRSPGTGGAERTSD